MTSFTLVYGDQRIPYQVQPDAKRTTRIAIHVDPDGSVTVDAPEGYSDAAIRSAVQKRARWVTSHVADAKARHAMVRPREFVSGEEVLYLGRRYVLKVIPVEAKPAPVKLKGNRVEVQTQNGSPDDIQGRLNGWYRVKGRDYIARRLDDLSDRLPWVEAPPAFRFLAMKRQWGSCSPNGEIILNPDLIKAPRASIEYVLIHELAHLKHHDHGPEFWALIDRHAEGWKDAKKTLDAWVELLSGR